MAKLEWDKVGEKEYELGNKKGVLFVRNSDGTYQNGVAWNGLTSVSESPEGGEQNDQYADDIKYISITTEEEFKGTIEAFTYPDQFKMCDGQMEVVPGFTISMQKRAAFGFCYRTTIGNDTEDLDHGYKLHIVYAAKCTPTEKSYETLNDSPEAMTFSWEFSTTKNYYMINGVKKKLAHIIIDSRKVADKSYLTKLEEMLYGTDNTDSQLPDPETIYLVLIGATELDPPTLSISGTTLTITDASGDAEYFDVYSGNTKIATVSAT